MSSLIVEVCLVDKVLKHTNADKLEIVLVKGWECIVQKGAFAPTAPASEDKPVCDKCNDTGAVDWGTGVSECPDCRHWGIGERKTNAEGEQQ